MQFLCLDWLRGIPGHTRPTSPNYHAHRNHARLRLRQRVGSGWLRLRSQLRVCDQSALLPLRHAVAVLRVTLRVALATGAVQTPPPLAEER